MTQGLGRSGDHLSAIGQPLEHRIPAALQRAEPHRRLQCKDCLSWQPSRLDEIAAARTPPQGLQIAEHEHEALAPLTSDRGKGHRRIGAVLQHQAGAGAQSVTQRVTWVAELGLDQQGLAGGIDARINREQRRLRQRGAAVGAKQLQRQPRPDPWGIDRRHLHARQQMVVADDAGERSAGLDQIPLLHLQIGNGAIDRGAEFAKGQISAAGGQLLTHRDVALAEVIPLEGGGGPLSHQQIEATEVEKVGLHLRAQPHHIGAGLGLIERQQQLAAPHPVTLPHQHPFDAS